MVISCCAPEDVQAERQPTGKTHRVRLPWSPASGQKKKGKKREISWKREPPEVALVSPEAGSLQATDLSQIQLFDTAIKCKLSNFHLVVNRFGDLNQEFSMVVLYSDRFT